MCAAALVSGGWEEVLLLLLLLRGRLASASAGLGARLINPVSGTGKMQLERLSPLLPGSTEARALLRSDRRCEDLVSGPPV